MKKYIDILAGRYKDNYPICILSKQNVFEKHCSDLNKILQKNIWFTCASDVDKKKILDKTIIFFKMIAFLKKIILRKQSKLIIKHISVGGSYLFKDSNNDIDFNVIVKGSHFSYFDYFEIDELNNLLDRPVKKISFMIFGENNFLYKDNTLDMIETKDYIHTSLCMREGLVFLMRNVTVFGNYFINREIDRGNLLVRIRRQIFHADLMLNKKIDLHKDSNAILLKAISRIAEALLYLAVGFPQLNIRL